MKRKFTKDGWKEVPTVKKWFHGRVKHQDNEPVQHYVLTATSLKNAHRRLARMLKRSICWPNEYQIIVQQIYGNLYSVAHTDYDTENIFG